MIDFEHSAVRGLCPGVGWSRDAHPGGGSRDGVAGEDARVGSSHHETLVGGVGHGAEHDDGDDAAPREPGRHPVRALQRRHDPDAPVRWQVKPLNIQRDDPPIHCFNSFTVVTFSNVKDFQNNTIFVESLELHNFSLKISFGVCGSTGVDQYKDKRPAHHERQICSHWVLQFPAVLSSPLQQVFPT